METRPAVKGLLCRNYLYQRSARLQRRWTQSPGNGAWFVSIGWIPARVGSTNCAG